VETKVNFQPGARAESFKERRFEIAERSAVSNRRSLMRHH
jgi:hypothetical protein